MWRLLGTVLAVALVAAGPVVLLYVGTDPLR